MPNHDDTNSINTCHHSRSLLGCSQITFMLTLQSAKPFTHFFCPAKICITSWGFLYSFCPSSSQNFLHKVSPCSAKQSPTLWATSLPSLYLWPSRATQVILQLRQFPPQPRAIDSVPALPVHNVLCTQVVHEQGFCDPAHLGNAEQS